jgi:hypothetical protein
MLFLEELAHAGVAVGAADALVFGFRNVGEIGHETS